MTLKELSQLYYLRKELDALKRRRRALRSSADALPGWNPDGVTRASGGASRVETVASLLADIDAMIQEQERRCLRERRRLEKYIAGIEDSQTRTIFALRFIEGLNWNQIADQIDSL